MSAIIVPILNSTAGLTLTPTQWHRTGLTHFGLEVIQLLQRPEYAKQAKIPGKLIIDAREVSVTHSGMIHFRGTDGSKQHIDVEQLFEWISRLNPEYVAYHAPLPLGLQALPTHLWFGDCLSDKAYHGYFIAQAHFHSILDASFEMDFQILDVHCQCESCQQGFTRAYLHHLFQHTPMLAQRYLMMHNMFVAAHQSTSILSLLKS